MTTDALGKVIELIAAMDADKTVAPLCGEERESFSEAADAAIDTALSAIGQVGP